MAYKKKTVAVHISIDDVFYVFEELQNIRYKSIFQHRFFRRLKKIHDRAGCGFTLYIFSSSGEKNLSKLRAEHIRELRDNRSWLKLGYHGPSPKMHEEYFEEGYWRFRKLLCIDKAMESNIVRLHKFQASPEQAAFLEKQGIKILLSADDERRSYDLTESESEIVKKEGTYKRIDTLLKYIRTDVRLESKGWKREACRLLKTEGRLVIFTHEWCINTVFYPIELKRLHNIVRLINKRHEIRFVV